VIRVLIVEDEAILAMNLQVGLEEGQCEVVGIACSAEEAVRQAGQTKPDIVVMDIKLKGAMDGIEAAIQINDKYGIPIMYLTGNTDDATRERAIHSHPLRYLEKPVESHVLCEVIKQAMGSVPLMPPGS